MISLTTVQRDLLQQLLTAEGPIGAVALGERLHVTSRQVLYGLREIKAWLDLRDVRLRHIPGVGVQVAGSPEQRRRLVQELVAGETGGRGADDVVVCVPSAALMAEGGAVMAPDGMLVLFAGVPNGTYAPLNLSDVYLHNAQFAGTSGSRLSDQQLVIDKTVAGALSPNRSVAAVGGIEAALDGLRALMEGRYPGKVVIFPQLSGLPLLGLPELKERYPDIAAKLGPHDLWTPAAEAALIEHFWKP